MGKVKCLILFVFSTFLIVNASAQDPLIVLHPVVGDTIDAKELSDYVLFQDYELDGIDYLILTKRDSIYTLDGFAKNVNVVNVRIPKEEIELQKTNVEKLNAYYSTMAKNDSVDVRIVTTVDSIPSQKINLDIATPALLKDIKKNNRRKRLSDYRQEVQKNREKGMIF